MGRKVVPRWSALTVAAVMVVALAPPEREAASAPRTDLVAASPQSTGTAQQSGASTCEALPPTTFDPGTGLLLPPWADHGGWGQAASFRTIQTGDVDGDGRAELIGRNANTIEVYTWSPGYPPPAPASPGATYAPGQEYNPDPGQWTLVVPGSGAATVDFSDASGWSDPSSFMTIQLANVDGLPGDELVARGPDGLQVRPWDHTNHTWASPLPVAGGPVWTNASGWGSNHPERYRTIRTGDVNGDGRAEIVGNGPNGMEVWGDVAGQLQRLDALPGDVPASAAWEATTYEIVELANIDGVAGDEFIFRDSEDGIRAFIFSDEGSGATWHELSGASGLFSDVSLGGSGLVWQYYRSFGTADLDGNGRDEVYLRNHYGLQAWTYDGGSWSAMVVGSVGGPADDLSDVNGWGPQQYNATIQTAQLFPGETQQLIARGAFGVFAFQAVPAPAGSEVPYLWASVDGVAISGFEDGPSSSTTWGPGFGPQPDTQIHTYPSNPTPADPALRVGSTIDVRYSTIQAVVPVAGQQAVVLGKNHLGVLTYNLDGTSTSAPWPGYSNLQGIPVQFPAAGQPPLDLSVLSPAGRAYWYLNTSMGSSIWPDTQQWNPNWTLLDQFRNPSSTLPNPEDLTPGADGQVRFEPNDPTLIPDEPGWVASSSALNVDRETYGRVSQDLADWTAGVTNVRDLIYGATGLRTLVLDTFVANTGRVQDVKPAFESGNPKMRSVTADLIWGVIGAIGALVAGPFEGMAAATINAVFGLVAAGGAAGMGARNPEGSTDTFADDLTSELNNLFCGANSFLDLSYTQVVGDYGLLSSFQRMSQVLMAAAPDFATIDSLGASGQLQWIWQQFANRAAGDNVQNFWVGVCDQGHDCSHWSKSDVGVWVSPENPSISYRLVGQEHNGNRANCGWPVQEQIARNGAKGSSAQQAWIDAFGTDTVAPAGPSFATPRRSTGYPFGNLGDNLQPNIGIQGWALGTSQCN